MSESVSLIRYEAAKVALAEAVRTDEVQQVRDFGLQMRAYAKIAKDRRIQADAAELIQRAERKLGVLIQNAKETGQLGIGRRSKSNVLGPEPKEDDDDTVEKVVGHDHSVERMSLEEIGVSKDLSARAQKWARMGDSDFEATLAALRDRIVSGGAKPVNVNAAAKKAKRQKREAELGARQAALPDKRYGVILADPEWRFEPYSRDSGMDRAADNHYPTSSLDEIMARPVQNIAADDCVLFLWATQPMLPQALAVMSSWGFTYKSHVIWRKAASHKAGLVLGTGYWFRNGHELLLVGTRGNVPAPAMGDQEPSVLDAEPLRHSQKPALFHELIEAYFPTLPKIELNARAARPGWDAWGNEAPFTESQSESINEATHGAVGESDSGVDGDVSRPSEGGGALTSSSVAAEDLKGEPSAAGESAPSSSAARLSKAEIDAAIRQGYAARTRLDDIAAPLGLSKTAVQKRARRMGLADPGNQRAAVQEANRRRVVKVDA